jgi:2-dehydro-3-deoxyphosphogluconate aldolase/(4S)-4-hydroxy-2-oxoglutarate aldolase
MTPSPADLLRAARIIPVLSIEEVATAVPLARALVAGGVHMLEVTLWTKAGAEAAEEILAEEPEAVVGLGTVLTRGDLDLARRFGVPFAFSPGATPELLDAAAKAGIPFLPGVVTASGAIGSNGAGPLNREAVPRRTARRYSRVAPPPGASPFPTRASATVGISEREARDYLTLPNALAMGGSWLAPATRWRLASGAPSRPLRGGRWPGSHPDGLAAVPLQAMRGAGRGTPSAFAWLALPRPYPSHSWRPHLATPGGGRRSTRTRRFAALPFGPGTQNDLRALSPQTLLHSLSGPA